MHSGCIRHTDLPGTSRLFADFLYRFAQVAQFYEYNHQNPDSYAEAARKLDFPESRREALVAALRQQNGPSPQLDLLAQPSTVVVVTGQQVGLFSGPCYTIYKAITAAHLTAELNQRGIPAVAVFWLATEDHDFEEVNHCWVLDHAHQPINLRVTATGGDHRPVGDVDIADFPVEPLRAALAEFPFGERVSDLVSQSYQPGRTMGAAFTSLLRSLLGGLHLLYLDPMHPSVRALAAPLLRDAVEAAPRIADLVLARNRELEEAGYHAQVHFEKKTSLFFLLDGDRRITLRRNGAGYAGDTIRIGTPELAARAEHLSPNALLRPVVQDYLLPTVAQIGGPAEVAYLAQSQVLYQALGRPAPVVVPRTGFTLLDPRASKLMDRYGLALQDVFEGFEALERKVSGKLVPPALRDSLRSVQGRSSALLDELYAELHNFDSTLAESLKKSRAKILYQFSKIEAKSARRALERDQRAAHDALYLYNLIYPNRHLQERVYTILPFLARHGVGLVDHLADSVRLDCLDHHVLPCDSIS